MTVMTCKHYLPLIFAVIYQSCSFRWIFYFFYYKSIYIYIYIFRRKRWKLDKDLYRKYYINTLIFRLSNVAVYKIALPPRLWTIATRLFKYCLAICDAGHWIKCGSTSQLTWLNARAGPMMCIVLQHWNNTGLVLSVCLLVWILVWTLFD